jgi:hypothetical protein
VDSPPLFIKAGAQNPIQTTNQRKMKMTTTILTIEQIEYRIETLWNGVKKGKGTSRLISKEQIEHNRIEDQKTILPRGWTMKQGSSPSRFEINYVDRIIETPKGHGNSNRYFNTNSAGENAYAGKRIIVWLLCGLKCMANQSDNFEFGIFGKGGYEGGKRTDTTERPEIDHCISRSTLCRWFIKGLISKEQFQYIGNLVLMRKSKNGQKSDRSEFSRVDKYFSSADVEKAKNELDAWIYSAKMNEFRVNRKDKTGLAMATSWAKLAAWYQIHQVTNTAFYRDTVGDLDPAEYPLAMVQHFHSEENDRVVNRNVSIVPWLLPS